MVLFLSYGIISLYMVKIEINTKYF